MIFELILLVGRAQAFDPLITDNTCRTVRESEFRLRRVQGVVLDAPNERRAEMVQREMEIPVYGVS
jgi:hypothetical protein